MNRLVPGSFASINIVGAINKALAKRSPIKRQPVPVVLTHKDTSEEKLMDVTTGSHDILFRTNTVFPFTLFPDTISMDRQQMTIIHRPFFLTAVTISVQIDDIFNLESHVGPFFGSVHLYSKYFTDSVRTINYLWRADALKIQRLIQGYMIARDKKIDCSTIEKSQLIILLNDLGQGASN